MLMVDGCAGLGGASQAMKDRGWTVITVDNDPKFQPDICTDIRNWHYFGDRPNLMWFSPPCTEYAREFMPWCRTGINPDMSIIKACLRIINESNPLFWVIENVKGALNWFKPILGKPSYVCNPYYLWGSFPDISYVKVKSNKEKLSSSNPEERGRIPYRLSRALAISIEQSIPIPFLER